MPWFRDATVDLPGSPPALLLGPVCVPEGLAGCLVDVPRTEDTRGGFGRDMLPLRKEKVREEKKEKKEGDKMG